ncbi:MAG: hypothetical protein HKN75_11255 [Bacteroidia bacterium]|nr:hypothetical protein [Bacteroidia bacterium]
MNFGIGSRVEHPEFGKGVIVQVTPVNYIVVFIEKGSVEISRSYTDLTVIEAVDPDPDLVSYAEVEKMFKRLIKQYSDIQETVQIGEKWRGGKLLMQPGDVKLSAKEIPVDTFFHKIVMLRDRVRVMEQKINSSKLEEDEKVALQQYITRIYGSLTTFNVLFRNKEDGFVGDKGSK